MAFKHRHLFIARVAAGAALLALAAPASAILNLTDPAGVDAGSAQAPKPAPSAAWIAQAAATPLHPETGEDEGPQLTAHQSLGIADPSQHLLHGASRNEDRDLSINESAVSRYNLPNEEPLLSENWWQGIPGIVMALVAGLALYMRHPIQRKRKYRSTPHEPYGPYKRRS